MKSILKPLLVLIVPFTFNAANAADFGSKIVGGVAAVEGEFPFIASLQNSRGHFCGGSLIAKNWVLTAAHCVKGGSISKVYIGAHNQKDLGNIEVFTAAKIVAHPDYNSSTTDFDYALIKLSGDSTKTPAIVNSDEIQIPLPSDSQRINVTVAGWGVTSEGSYSLPNILQKVNVPLVDQQTCNNAYSNKITNRMLCAGLSQGGKDSCQGDSGGPLVTKGENNEYTLVGVVSWGQGCARANKYGVYSKVNFVTSWIESETRN